MPTNLLLAKSSGAAPIPLVYHEALAVLFNTSYKLLRSPLLASGPLHFAGFRQPRLSYFNSINYALPISSKRPNIEPPPTGTYDGPNMPTTSKMEILKNGFCASTGKHFSCVLSPTCTDSVNVCCTKAFYLIEWSPSTALVAITLFSSVLDSPQTGPCHALLKTVTLFRSQWFHLYWIP